MLKNFGEYFHVLKVPQLPHSVNFTNKAPINSSVIAPSLRRDQLAQKKTIIFCYLTILKRLRPEERLRSPKVRTTHRCHERAPDLLLFVPRHGGGGERHLEEPVALQDGRDLVEDLLYYVTSDYLVIQQCLSMENNISGVNQRSMQNIGHFILPSCPRKTTFYNFIAA